jgi:hypothetical protein
LRFGLPGGSRFAWKAVNSRTPRPSHAYLLHEEDMNRTATLSVVLAAFLALVTTPPAIAKLPPGTTFEACGASGCATAAGDESFALQLKLIEPTMEHGTVGAPSGAQAWIRVDLNLGSDRGLDSLRRNFPVVFASDAGYIGVPGEQGAYRWVPLRAEQSQAYAQVADGMRPFPPQTLTELDPVSVAQATPSAARMTPAGGEGMPTPLIIGLAAVGLLAGVVVVARARRVRHRPTEGEPA